MVKLFIALLMIMFAGTVSAQTVEPADLKLELSFEERTGPLYTGEMVLLKVRGFYKIRIAREMLVQPDFDGFDWMQLGTDTWSKDTTKGGEILQFERVIALFPNRTGTLEIKPFEHQLELWTLTGERFDHVLASAPLSIEVTEPPDVAGWWLPARRLTVQDKWSNAPDKLDTGEGALRVVMVTVEGVLPEHVPPMPKLESAGAYVFAHPEKRIRRLYKRGPVTRVFWRWTIRPENPPSAYLKSLRLPYFDTTTREHKEIVIAAQRIAMTDEAVEAFLSEADETSVAAVAEARRAEVASEGAPRFASLVTPLGLLAGLVGGVAVMMPSLRFRRRKDTKNLLTRLRPDPDARALKQAAARGDGAAARNAGLRLITKGEGDVEQMHKALAAFDRCAFAAREREPDLRSFARSMLSARRHHSKP